MAGRRCTGRYALVAWILAVVIVATTLVITDRATAGETDYQGQARGALGGLDDADAEVLRVVIIGDSLSRNAFGDGSGLQGLLRGAGHPARVVNLSAPALTLKVFEPLADHVLAVSPDIVVLQPEITVDAGVGYDGSLRTRIDRWLRPTEPTDYLALGCRPMTADLLEQRVDEISDRLGDSPDLDRAERFVQKLGDDRIQVVISRLPISPDLDARTSDVRASFRAQVFDRLVAEPNVTLDGGVEDFLASEFCDFSHLNQAGRSRFLAAWVTDLVELVDDR